MVDINVKGLLYGIAAALPIFRRQGFGHFVNTISTAGIQISPGGGRIVVTKMVSSARLESVASFRSGRFVGWLQAR